jgi:uncharacterized membrane protein affecting hemolysin expression
MDRKVATKAGRTLYQKRQQIVEPVFGQIKGGGHIRDFMGRGRVAAASERKVICGTHDLVKRDRRSS